MRDRQTVVVVVPRKSSEHEIKFEYIRKCNFRLVAQFSQALKVPRVDSSRVNIDLQLYLVYPTPHTLRDEILPLKTCLFN